jgi:hypothetical protein
LGSADHYARNIPFRIQLDIVSCFNNKSYVIEKLTKLPNNDSFDLALALIMCEFGLPDCIIAKKVGCLSKDIF